MAAVPLRPLLYLTSGFFSSVKLPMHVYIICTITGILGSMAGDWVSHHVDQATFSQLVNVLVVMAACLMLAGGTGVTSS